MEEEAFMDIKGLIEIIRKRIWIFVSITITVVGISIILSFWIIQPLFEAKTTILVGKSFEGENDKIDYNDILVYQNVVKTYVEIAKSVLIAEKTIQKLGKDLTPEALLENIQVDTQEDTQIMVIRARSRDAGYAMDTVNYLAESFIEECQKLLPTGSVKVVDRARLPSKPIYPKPSLYISIGFLTGFMLSLIIILIVSNFDNTIKTEEDLLKYTNIPVLGIIPMDGKLKNR